MDRSVAAGLEQVRRRLVAAAERAGRDPADVTLVVVTKRVPAARIRQAVAAGETVMGENYVREALGKMDEIGPGVRWHLIGHLQRNKVKQAVSRFDLIQSVDSPDLGR